jgi:MoaA/NifB/PqqE/SkfB family radical SAM enzyme
MIATAEPLARPEYALELREAGLSVVSLPIYGATAATHDAIVRTPGAYSALMRTYAGAREAGITIYFHALALQQNVHEIAALQAFAKAEEVPLLVGLPRPKANDAHPSPAAVAQLAKEVDLIGVPACVAKDSAKSNPQEAGSLLERFGPMVIYFGVQAGNFAPECRQCVLQSQCWGFPHGSESIWRNHLVPALVE